MDTERENLRQLFLDFIDTQPDDDEWDDTDAQPNWWKRYLQTYDDLLAEVEQLREAIEYAIAHTENHDVIRVLDEVMKND
jgi:hypothetical protein